MEAGSSSSGSSTRPTPKADGEAELRDALNKGHPLSLTCVGQGSEEIDQFPKVRLTGCEVMISRINDDLPDDVITIILQALSTTWVARLSPASAQDTKRRITKKQWQKRQEKNKLAIDFRKQVGEWSKDWNSFGPVFISKHHCITYHRPSDTWQSMPPMSFLPENIFMGSELQLDGPLLFVSRPETSSLLSWHQAREYVANLVTRSWKCLPARPPVDGQCLVKTLVTYPALQMYKVILFHGDSDPEISHINSQIYDSKSDSWSSKRHDNVEWDDGLNYSELSNPVHFNGVLYMYVDKNPNNLLSFDIERTHLQNNEMQVSGYSGYDRKLMAKGRPVDLVVCNGELFAVVFVSRDRFRGTSSILVWKVPLIVTRPMYMPGPPYMGLVNIEDIEFVNQAFSDGQCIFFREKGGNRMLEYNMQENDWREFHLPESVSTAFSSFRNYKQEDERAFSPRDPRNYEWSLSSFRPGLNPFMTV